MKNIHVIQTDKPSRLFKHQLDEVTLDISKHLLHRNYGFHIYITSDEEIKERDYFIAYSVTSDKKPFIMCASEYKERKKNKGKIILTTDQNLIKDGVQAIDDEFLEWFVKNPSYEYVLITNDFEQVNQDNPVLKGSTNLVLKYKITMLGEKSNKQETLEEVSERLFKSYSNPTALSEGHYDYVMDKDDFKEDVKELFSYQQQTNLHT